MTKFVAFARFMEILRIGRFFVALVVSGSVSGWGTLFTFSAEGSRLSEERLGAAKTEVRRNVVVKSCWSFMVKVTRLSRPRSSHNYRYINVGYAAADLEVEVEVV